MAPPSGDIYLVSPNRGVKKMKKKSMQRRSSPHAKKKLASPASDPPTSKISSMSPSHEQREPGGTQTCRTNESSSQSDANSSREPSGTRIGGRETVLPTNDSMTAWGSTDEEERVSYYKGDKPTKNMPAFSPRVTFASQEESIPPVIEDRQEMNENKESISDRDGPAERDAREKPQPVHKGKEQSTRMPPIGRRSPEVSRTGTKTPRTARLQAILEKGKPNQHHRITSSPMSRPPKKVNNRVQQDPVAISPTGARGPNDGGPGDSFAEEMSLFSIDSRKSPLTNATGRPSESKPTMGHVPPKSPSILRKKGASQVQSKAEDPDDDVTLNTVMASQLTTPRSGHRETPVVGVRQHPSTTPLSPVGVHASRDEGEQDIEEGIVDEKTPHRARDPEESRKKPSDLLDYIFENVEGLLCREEQRTNGVLSPIAEGKGNRRLDVGEDGAGSAGSSPIKLHALATPQRRGDGEMGFAPGKGECRVAEQQEGGICNMASCIPGSQPPLNIPPVRVSRSTSLLDLADNQSEVSEPMYDIISISRLDELRTKKRELEDIHGNGGQNQRSGEGHTGSSAISTALHHERKKSRQVRRALIVAVVLFLIACALILVGASFFRKAGT